MASIATPECFSVLNMTPAACQRAEEEQLLPGQSSDNGFLKPGKKLLATSRKDKEVLDRLGVSFEAVAKRLKYFVDFTNKT